MNKTMNEKNKKTIRKMNKYINTFPLDDQAILQIQQDIEGMAQEAQEREEPLEQIIGKDPREFCDDLIYAVGGIKTPGGRKMLRIAGAIYQTLGAFGIIDGLFFLLTDLFLSFGEFLSTIRGFGFWKEDMFSILSSIIFGVFYLIAGKKGFQYSADVSQANKAMRWGVGLLGLELLGFIEAVFDTPLEAVISLAIGCIPAIMYIIGARRNRPHTEEAI